MHCCKYSASGNDFIIFHALRPKDRSELARRVCNRHEGIGADGLIILLPHATLDYEWEFYNSDGSLAEMCGNGGRAAALYAYEQDLAGSKQRFLSGSGIISATVFTGGVVEVELAKASILEKNIHALDHDWWLLDTGVPHLVAFENPEKTLSTDALASLRHTRNANVNVIKQEEDSIWIRTFERGVEGETLACGTGMAAAFLRAKSEGRVGDNTKLIPASQEILELSMREGKILFKGKVKKVCDIVSDSKKTQRVSS